MAKRPVTVGDLHFATTGEALKHFQVLLFSLPLGRVPDQHSGVLHDLLRLHSEAAEKIGCGIDHFVVRKSPVEYHSGQQFAVVRTDGTVTEFSYSACIRPPTPWDDLRAAMRAAVSDDIYSAKVREFSRPPVFCEETAEPLSVDCVHVDHAAPLTFEVIVYSYLRLHRYSEADWPRLVRDHDSGSGIELATEGLRLHFRDYHHRIARLRFVHPAAHLKAAAQGRFKKIKRPVTL